jgi:vancomycin resistance protein YoaR
MRKIFHIKNHSKIYSLSLFSFVLYASFGIINSSYAQTSPLPNINLIFEEKIIETLSSEVYKNWISFSYVIKKTDTPSSLINTQYCHYQEITNCSFEYSQRTLHQRNIFQNVHIKEDILQEYLKTLQEKSRKEPKNAKFKLESENRVSVFSPGENGKEITLEENKESLSQVLHNIFSKRNSSEPIPLTLHETILSPKIQSSDAEDFGITSLIGEGKSNFSGSSNDRLFNIEFGAEKFHGILVKPEEEFSFVEILGEVDQENGWRPELVIRNNRTEPEYGGGICQISTTLFRSAVHAGLRITMRQNHSYPVKYYEPIGFDASVYVPMPDFRFVNNTPNHILIQREIDGNELIFRIYGTDDGRKVFVDDPQVLEERKDGSIKTVFTQRVKNADDTILFEKKFFSNYNNPKDYPKPEDIDLTEKPKDWSKRQWEEYKKEIEEYLNKNQ